MNRLENRIVNMINCIYKLDFGRTRHNWFGMSLCVRAITILILPCLFSCAHQKNNKINNGLPDLVTVNAIGKVHKVFPDSMTDKDFLKICPSITNVSAKIEPLDAKDSYLLKLSWDIKRPPTSFKTETTRDAPWFLSFNKNRIFGSYHYFNDGYFYELLSIKEIQDNGLYYVEHCSWTDCKIQIDDLEKGQLHEAHLWNDCNNYDPKNADNLISSAYIHYRTVTVDLR